MALWGRKDMATAPGGAPNGQGGHALTGLEQHEWRSSSWTGVRTEPLAEPLADDDLLLTEMEADVAPVAEVAPVVEPVPEPAPEPVIVAAPEPVASEPAPVVMAAPEPVERTDDTGRSQFFAGRGVKLKAEVSGCDIFRVEGDFDGTVTARRMFISPTGVFKGTGTVEEAEVEGRIEGTLTVTGVLVLKSTGRVSGSVSYGQIEIERGGHLHGDVAPKAAPEQPSASSGPRATAAPLPQPVRVSAPKPAMVATPTPVVEPTPASPTPRKTVLPPLSFGAKKN